MIERKYVACVASTDPSGLKPIRSDAGVNYVPISSTLLDGEGLNGSSTMSDNDAVKAYFGANWQNYTINATDLIVLNSTAAASAGDIFPHVFLQPKAAAETLAAPRVFQDLKNATGIVSPDSTRVKLVGDADSRLVSGIKVDRVPLAQDGSNIVPLFFGEGGVLSSDTYGSYSVQGYHTAPYGGASGGTSDLLKGWYDQTVWKDLGLLNTPQTQFKLGTAKEVPVYGKKDSWRDSWLEHAIWRLIPSNLNVGGVAGGNSAAWK